MADVRSSSGASPPAAELRPPSPRTPPRGAQTWVSSPRLHVCLEGSGGRCTVRFRGSVRPSPSAEARPSQPDVCRGGRREGARDPGLSGEPSAPLHGVGQLPDSCCLLRPLVVEGLPGPQSRAESWPAGVIPRGTGRTRPSRPAGSGAAPAAGPSHRRAKHPQVQENLPGFLTFKCRLVRQQLAFLRGPRSFSFPADFYPIIP